MFGKAHRIAVPAVRKQRLGPAALLFIDIQPERRPGVIAADRWASIAFTPHTSARMVPCGWRVDAAWKQVDEDQQPTAPAKADGALRVWRQRTGTEDAPLVFHAWMDPLEADAFTRLLDGQPFGRICDAIASHFDGDPETAAATAFRLLQNWLSDGLLTGLR